MTSSHSQHVVDAAMGRFDPEFVAMERYRLGQFLRALFRDPNDSDGWIGAERDQETYDAWERDFSERFAASCNTEGL
jgi:hypothetical protein